MALFFDLEFDQGMVSRVHVFGFASFTQVVVGANTALEANACDGGHLAPVTGNPLVNDSSIRRLTVLDQWMFWRMCRACLTLCAEVKITAHGAVETGAHDGEDSASIAPDVVMAGTAGTALRSTRLLALKAEVEISTRKVVQGAKQGSKRGQGQSKACQVELAAIEAARENIHGV